MIKTLYRLGVFAAIAALPRHVAGQRTLDPAVALRTRGFLPRSPIAASPDGKWVAYATQRMAANAAGVVAGSLMLPDGLSVEQRGAEVFVTSVDTRETIALDSAGSTSWGVSWSPDGKLLAFLSNRDGAARLWIWE